MPDSEPEIDTHLIDSVLRTLCETLASALDTGRPGAIDLRAVPQMNAVTYRALRDALGTGEVVATIEVEGRVDVRETQYAGVWWVSHLNERGATVTELIEVTEIPAILKSNVFDMGRGLTRLRGALEERGRAGTQPPSIEPEPCKRTASQMAMASHPEWETTR